MTIKTDTRPVDTWKDAAATQSIADLMGRRPRILVVDDQAVNIQALYRVFSSDHQVFMATSGAQALIAVEEKLPDIVLLDIEMPDIDGFEVCKRIRSNPLLQHIPIIFVTSHNDSVIEARGLSIGAVDFISKPVSRDIVLARVRTHLLLKQQTDLLRNFVYVDGMTGAFNRRYFDERFVAEWGRAYRHGGPLTVLMIDVDRFKLYNDNYGHQLGDEVLRRVVAALKGEVKRAADVLARYGGEEFVCLLPDTDMAGAATVAGKLNAAVQALGIEHLHSQPYNVVTVSIGGATYRAGDQVDAAELMKLADRQLYLSKSGGRNRFSLVEAPSGNKPDYTARD